MTSGLPETAFQILGHRSPEAKETGTLWVWFRTVVQDGPPRIQSAPTDKARANNWRVYSPKPLSAILI